jgi:3-dehydroquinate synthase
MYLLKLTEKPQICSRKNKILKEYYLKDFSIYIGNDVFERLLENLIERSYSKVFVVVDENTEKYCLPALSKYLFDIKLIRIRAGEQNKNIQTAQLIWNELQDRNADRNSVLINLGGGIVGDIGGFCAATFKRGMDYINVPTTLLAMVDSSIGGKTGIDYNGLKNAIGVIQQPTAIYINPDLLHTLPKEELLNGFAEIIKHGLILDKTYFEKIIKIGFDDWSKISTLIHGSIKLKLDVVKKDPTERSYRKILNFGHTVGHAIEAYSLMKDKKPLKHGEAVAIGMICEAYLSKVELDLSNKELRQISDFISKYFNKYSLRSILSPELIRIMKQDKKNEQDDAINFTLLKKIGKGSVNHVCSETQITAALNYYDGL